ncbi:helix-turn-helix domain-containing protein [Pseudonocardia endophytica]|uniref:GAF domain-containing protein n=1 Tax=Pseudonocardia endophytica TaxID=401976 RepID=A0A4R1HTD4_PSEEN|nr:helix-turn-helix domain-containing protein [Pseudonocardia endophytica]TCK20672.1 GAF domain-containing protein [Pseudonocardia endophytica]
MVPSELGTALMTAVGTGGLTRLLQTRPDEPRCAAEALAAAVTQEIGAPVRVLDGTRLLAGVSWPGDGGGRVEAAGITVRWADASHPVPWDLLRQACVWLSLLRDHADVGSELVSTATEVDSIRDVAGRLLSVRDADQVLLSVADWVLRLLGADICGVLLREGDEVRMQSCVGHRSVETSRLRMKRGQGVAGLVFLTGEPAKVDSYLEDRTISQDFMSLAEREETRSALAVPLRLQGELVGVLEVWRRRESVFTDRDVRRMVTLADFATIAIDNARLHDVQVQAMQSAEEARDQLARQMTVLDRTAQLQQTLLSTVVQGGGLAAIARTVAVEFDCEVGVYGPDGGRLAVHSGPRLTSSLPESLAASGARGAGQGRWIRPVHADGDRVGQVCLLTRDQPAEVMDAVAGHVAMACSLALLRERAASRARAEAMEQVLWDLLQGPVEHRLAARTRAQQLSVALGGALRVVYGQIENLDLLAAEHGWETAQLDRVRRDVLRAVRCPDDGRAPALAGLRGDFLVAIGTDLDRDGARDLVNSVAAAVREQSGVRLSWGISREHADVVELPSALNEAQTALSAAHRLGGENVFLYEELGIVRLLLGSGDDPDLQAFVDEVTGPLLAYDRDNDGSLVRTLRAFFDADCSQRVAAERLFVHHKTLRYRLERIRSLTGLDLSRHEDRMRADFALRLLQVNRCEPGEGLTPGE